MGDKTKIEWADASWNPIRARRLDGTADVRFGWHCERVSEGCRNCYAAAMNKRLGTGLDFKPGELYYEGARRARADMASLFLDEKMLTIPLRWKRPRMIFVCSMTDLFADFVPDDWIAGTFGMMALCPQHTFQVLTKRPARMRQWMESRDREPVSCVSDLYVDHPDIAGPYPFDKDRAISVGTNGWPLPNVWLGVSAEDQNCADERIPDLLATPAALRFISAEPLLGPIDLEHVPMSKPDEHTVFRTLNVLTGRRGHGGKCGYTETCDPLQPHLDWVIVGGESGPGARPFPVDTARRIIADCKRADVPVFMKQMGAVQVYGTIPCSQKHSKGGDPSEWPADLRVRQTPYRETIGGKHD